MGRAICRRYPAALGAVVTIVGLASAGASAFFQAAETCPHIDFALLTDRECAAERTAERTRIQHVRIPFQTRQRFSQHAFDWVERLPRVGAVIALYDRILAPPMIGRLPMLNIHPSLLPAFPGMGALRAARDAGVTRFGATLHGMTERVDEGPIVAQVASAREPGESLERMERKSFVHKLYLILLAIDMLERDRLRFVDGLPVFESGSRLENARYLARVEAVERLEDVRAV